MIDIDFLPIQYHQKNAYRQAKPWQIVVVSSFLGLVALVTISQYIHRRFVENELNGLAPAYEMALSQKNQLADLQNKLDQIDAEAELIVYLHTPWPRSQLLAALASRIPQEIILEQLQIIREGANSISTPGRAAPIVSEISTNKQKSAPSAKLDLQSMQNLLSNKQIVVLLVGTTTDSAALHRFLEKIQSASLFSKAELVSANTENNKSDNEIQFNIKLIVKAGYWQQEGPIASTNINKPR